MPRAMGLDVGTKTIGVAISDELRMLAHPTCTVARSGVRKDTEVLLRLVREREVDHVVVGLPLELDGREERPARLARQIGEALGEAAGLPVAYVDERFSSVQAERRLLAAGLSRQRRKQVIDQEAAVILLQGWLDHGADVEEAG
ncbi:MAG: Holliday junction resolvase RuvX [Alphaproteobacteria bacterium]|nr:Holliday junction resolvase RuvX [Alphaproteobacteria bacterium]